MVKAVFLDFYGTVVHEDGEIIKKITDIIVNTGQVTNMSDIGAFWWNDFQTMFHNSHGENFETQRCLEYKSLENTLRRFNSTANPQELSDMMFRHWRKPPIFEDTKEFFSRCPIPIYIVSNIDTDDIMAAIEYHNLTPQDVFTSEDAKSYKPHKGLFEMALRKTGLRTDDVVHIGDSLSSDVKGAGALGINTIWLNRSDREVPNNVIAVSNLVEALNTKYFRE